jgi:hypothetical protein
MTTVERSPMPVLEFERRSCDRCGASTYDDILEKCVSGTDMHGENDCLDCLDDEDFLIYPTKESLDEMDKWCEKEGNRMDEEMKSS